MKLTRNKLAAFQMQVSKLHWNVRQCSNDHWQVTGAYATPINIHWCRGGQLSIYVNGAVAGTRVQPSVEAVIAFIQKGGMVSDRVDQRICMTNQKRKLWWWKPHECEWCLTGLSFEAATVDHLVPLSKGGSNRLDNLCLACSYCNQFRGNSLKPLESWNVQLCGGTG